PSGPTAAQIAAAAHAAAIKSMSGEHHDDDVAELTGPAHDDATPGSEAPGSDATGSDAPGSGAPAEDSTRTADTAAESTASEVIAGENVAEDATPASNTADSAPAASTAPATVIAEVGTSDEQPEPVQAVARPAQLDEPVVRPRRKRGRVVAPAGPPRAAETSSTPAESAPEDLEQAEGDR
ncbi:hypothetical protein N798_12805, partial [Knoellia flava TL1]